jgi:uncharacterized protein (TIGR02996 family)
MHDERAFLREIANNPDSAAARLVYADWLEEQGECDRAEFLRLEVELGDMSPTESAFLKLNARFHELHGRLDAKWLASLDRTEIENCRLEFRFQCPARWENLKLTDVDDIRFCESCRKKVYHCGSIQQARNHAHAGRCVAVDSRLMRMPDDLYEMPTTTELVVGRLLPVEDSEMRSLIHQFIGRGRVPQAPPEPAPARKRWWQFWK